MVERLWGLGGTARKGQRGSQPYVMSIWGLRDLQGVVVVPGRSSDENHVDGVLVFSKHMDTGGEAMIVWRHRGNPVLVRDPSSLCQRRRQGK